MSGTVFISLFDTFISAYPALFDEFKKKGLSVTSKCTSEPLTEKELIPCVKDADALVVGLGEYNRNVVYAAQKAKIIAAYGVGYNHIDLQAATERNIAVTNAPGANARSTAELAIGLMLNISRSIVQSHNLMHQNKWYSFSGNELTGKTLGIIGTGKVGLELARIAFNGFNMKILAYDIFENSNITEECRGVYVDLDQLYRTSDYISIHLPHNKQTVGFISSEQIKLMKSTAILINVARGGIVDENDLYEALRNKAIAGAGLDVYTHEPPIDKKILQLDNIITTSHIGGSTKEAVKNIGDVTVDNVCGVLLNGERAKHCVNPEIYN